MSELQDELRALFTDTDELLPTLVAAFVASTESEARSQVDLGRWNLAVSLGVDIRILFPDAGLPVSDTLWTARMGQLLQARPAGAWADVSRVAYELKLLVPERAGELGLDDDAFASLDYELPSVFDHASQFLVRAYELAVLYPHRRAEISAYDEFLPTVLAAIGRVPAPNYMDYPWLAAHLRVLYPSQELTLDEHHMRSSIRDCRIDLDLARRGAQPRGFAAKAAPLKLLAASEIQLTDRGPVAVLG